MPPRIEIHCGPHSRTGDCRNAFAHFGHGQMGRPHSWSANHRRAYAQKHGGGAAQNSHRQICSRIYPRNEGRSPLCQVSQGGAKASDRKSGPQASRAHGLENKNKTTSTPAALGNAASRSENQFALIYLFVFGSPPTRSIG